MVLSGYRRAVAEMARAGNDVVVAECKFDSAGWEDWSEALRGLDPLWVGVRCSLEECVRREVERKDRLHGLAAGHFDIAHLGATYALEVDLTDGRIDKVATQILRAVGKTKALDPHE